MSSYYTDAQLDARAEHFEQRRNRLVALARKFWIAMPEEWENCRSSSEEDMWLYLYGDEVIEQWAAVTFHPGRDGEVFYVKTFPTRRNPSRW